MAVSAIAAAFGVALNNPDLTVGASLLLVTSGTTFLVSDAIVVDGEKHLIRRRRGVWPLVNEVTRPFSDVDHVYIEEMPTIESDGSEVTISRLSLVRKFGSPIILANAYEARDSIRAEADHLARLLGVEARSSECEMRANASVL